MRSNYKVIGDYIKQVKGKNTAHMVTAENLKGININKYFMPSVANIIGTDLSKYKIVQKNQFSCNRMHVGRDYRLPIAVSSFDYDIIVSPAYDVFEIKDITKLLPEYLMMWFLRSEFDRNSWFYTDSDVRGRLGWQDFCAMQLPIPSLEKQREIVKEYQTITDRIKLNEGLNKKLEDTAQSIYKEWFVNFESQEKIKLDKYIEFNPKHTINKKQITSYVEMADVQEDSMSLRNIIQRHFTSGSKFKNKDILLARITPCLENGKTAFVTGLETSEVAYGSTEFIVMRAKKDISPYWIYCLAREDNFRSYAISSMIGSSGRQRVHSDYLKEYEVSVNIEKMYNFNIAVKPIFDMIDIKTKENKNLVVLAKILLSKMATIKG
jgi:type I restriction enzyme S subunit